MILTGSKNVFWSGSKTCPGTIVYGIPWCLSYKDSMLSFKRNQVLGPLSSPPRMVNFLSGQFPWRLTTDESLLDRWGKNCFTHRSNPRQRRQRELGEQPPSRQSEHGDLTCLGRSGSVSWERSVVFYRVFEQPPCAQNISYFCLRDKITWKKIP